MSKLDNTLQQRLEELELGKPIDQVVNELPKGEQELASLLRLVDQTRTISHPALSLDKANAQHERLMAEFHTALRGNRLSTRLSQPRKKESLWDVLQNLIPAPKVRYGLAISLVAVIAVFGIWLYNAGPISAHEATLANVTGMVEILNAQGAATGNFVSSGAHIQQGQSIRTYASSGATLVYFDGSQTAIGADSSLTLAKLDGGWNDSLQVQISQDAGTTVHSVVPLKGSSSFYQVLTPSGQASVHGTNFQVDVSPDGKSLFAVNQGKVQVDAGGGQVFLTSGQATLVMPDTTPQAPSFQFILQGKLSSAADGQWMVDGITFTIDDQTTQTGSPQTGSFVTVRGRILSSGEWIADRIKLAQAGTEKARFTGLVQSMSAISWQVGGKTLAVNSETEIDAGLAIGDPVEVTFKVQADNTWLATDIEAQIGADENRTPTESDTSTAGSTDKPKATDTEDSTQTEGQSAGAGTEASQTTSTGNYCADLTLVQPEGKTLADKYDVQYTEIMGWFCQGYGFGEIDLAYSISEQTGITVEDIFAMRKSGSGWGQISQTLLPTPTEKPTHENAGQGKPPTKTPDPTNTPHPTNENRPTQKNPPNGKP